MASPKMPDRHGNFNDISGQVFGRLTVLEEHGRAKNGCVLWLCACACGAKKIASGSDLRSGDTKSCGCLLKETINKHGNCKRGRYTRTYKSWAAMLSRCRNGSLSSSAYYKDAGVSVCKRWLSFECFLEDMGERPVGKTLDRVDSSGNYNKRNCRWATPIEQVSNRRFQKARDMPVGVRLNHGKFEASTSVGGRYRYLGRYDDKESAHIAYLAAIAEYA